MRVNHRRRAACLAFLCALCAATQQRALALDDADSCLCAGRSMQLVIIANQVRPGLCASLNNALRLGWRIQVIGYDPDGAGFEQFQRDSALWHGDIDVAHAEKGAPHGEKGGGRGMRRAKPMLIGAALDAERFAAAIGDDVIMLLDG